MIERNQTEAFMIEDPRKISRVGNFKPIPWMQGFLQNEGAIRAARKQSLQLKKK